jgi:hypothetical protein
MLVAPFESDLKIAETQGVPSTLDMISFWVHAIAQHYGGDSNYLDVTGDLQSALWFALHQMTEKSGSIVLGTGDALDPEHDVLVKQTYWKYERWEGPAYLYVFDVPPWRGEASLAHGSLIDVSEQAPQLVGESARMTVQRACLLHADGDVGDLASFYACPPMQVDWPMADADRLSPGTREIFPPPTVDPWYATFLQQPLTLAPDAGGTVRFERPIPVALYLYDEPSDRNDLAARLTLDQPPLAGIPSASASFSSRSRSAAVRRNQTRCGRRSAEDLRGRAMADSSCCFSRKKSARGKRDATGEKPRGVVSLAETGGAAARIFGDKKRISLPSGTIARVSRMCQSAHHSIHRPPPRAASCPALSIGGFATLPEGAPPPVTPGIYRLLSHNWLRT